MHYDDGFALYADADISSVQPRLLWKESFEKLRSSSDDNQHLLSLDFHGEEGVMVSDALERSTRFIVA